MNLIPNKPGSSKNYWCTWSTQNVAVDAKKAEAIEISEAYDGVQTGSMAVQDILGEHTLFGDKGWLTKEVGMLSKVREDLYVMMDQGWDVPLRTDQFKEVWKYGSIELPEDKYPSFHGSPEEKLLQLNNKIKAEGWRGAGLWIAQQMTGDGKAGFINKLTDAERHWKERAIWCRNAGIEYWKVDWGARGVDIEFRRMLSSVAKSEVPGLVLEHVRCMGPLNDIAMPWDKGSCGNAGRFGTWCNVLEETLDIYSFSEVFRSYDVTAQLSVSSTMDRIFEILTKGKVNNGVAGIINCEDEVYLAAALGFTMGIMRSPFYLDKQHSELKMDEVVRGVMWQRIAPAFRFGEASPQACDMILSDKWLFNKGDTWAENVIGKEIIQSAPAAITRGIPLPTVLAKEGIIPYVVAAMNPNGAVSIATLPRTLGFGYIFTPLADVTIEIADYKVPIGIFGKYNMLILKFKELPDPLHVWMQDLAGDKAVDITERVVIKGLNIELPGELIMSIGTSAASKGDISEPGCVLVIRR